MKTLKKFSTFHDMKADEATPADRATRLKKHAAFEQLMMEMMAVHRGQSTRTRAKE